MAKCAVCDKSVHFGNAVSHSHRRSNKMWKSNLKSVRVKVNGGTKEDVRLYFLPSFRKSGKSIVHSILRIREPMTGDSGWLF